MNQEAQHMLHSRLNLIGVRTAVAMDDVQPFLLTLHHWFRVQRTPLSLDVLGREERKSDPMASWVPGINVPLRGHVTHAGMR